MPYSTEILFMVDMSLILSSLLFIVKDQIALKCGTQG